MTRANTRRGMADADILIEPALSAFNSLAWRRAEGLADAGYKAAEALSAELLPLAVDAETWDAYLAAREAKRRLASPRVSALEIIGATPGDEQTIRRLLHTQIGRPLDARKVARDITRLSGLDRYHSLSWDLDPRGSAYALIIRRRDRRPICRDARRR